MHHLHFTDADYDRLGAFIKWNPAIKTADDRDALWKALLDDRLDVIATDHAPHTESEKRRPYFESPSGGPLVGHSLPILLNYYHEGKISLEKLVEKACHAPAILFDIEKRGFIREGFYADLVLVDLDATWRADRKNLHYKCGWSPVEGMNFKGKIVKTFVNGVIAYSVHDDDTNANGEFTTTQTGMRLSFDRRAIS